MDETVFQLLVKRKDALELGLKRYFTGKPCKRGHVAERITSSKECMGCLPEKNAEAKRRRPNWHKEHYAKLMAKNPNIWKEKYAADPDSQKARCAKWYKKNKHVATARLARRRAVLRNAAPGWLTKEDHKAIRRVYKQAAEMTKLTGIPHEVDHIYPLKGETMCGLHVPSNLRVITTFDNRSKGNRLSQGVAE